jgi:hypothetical protein
MLIYDIYSYYMQAPADRRGANLRRLMDKREGKTISLMGGA